MRYLIPYVSLYTFLIPCISVCWFTAPVRMPLLSFSSLGTSVHMVWVVFFSFSPKYLDPVHWMVWIFEATWCLFVMTSAFPTQWQRPPELGPQKSLLTDVTLHMVLGCWINRQRHHHCEWGEFSEMGTHLSSAGTFNWDASRCLVGTGSMAPEKDGTGQKQADCDRGKGCVWSISTPWDKTVLGCWN